MLSNLIINNQRRILIIDENDKERIANKFIRELLRQQGQDDDTIKELPLCTDPSNTEVMKVFLNECKEGQPKTWNILLPAFSDFLCYQNDHSIIKTIYYLSRFPTVKRVFLWVSTCHIDKTHAEYQLAALQHISDLVLHMQSPTKLSILTRLSGGSVTHKVYNYKIEGNEIHLEPITTLAQAIATAKESEKARKPKGTFKIDLNEEEQIARNSLKLPYEKVTAEDVNMIYSSDDEDEEESDFI